MQCKALILRPAQRWGKKDNYSCRFASQDCVDSPNHVGTRHLERSHVRRLRCSKNSFKQDRKLTSKRWTGNQIIQSHMPPLGKCLMEMMLRWEAGRDSSLRCLSVIEPPEGQKIIYTLFLGTFQHMPVSDDVHRPQPRAHCQRMFLSLVFTCICPMLTLKSLSFFMFFSPCFFYSGSAAGPFSLTAYRPFE